MALRIPREENCDAYRMADPAVDVERRGARNFGVTGTSALNTAQALAQRVRIVLGCTTGKPNMVVS
jgi:hypothetical protein